jgi:hypothetical protein
MVRGTGNLMELDMTDVAFVDRAGIALLRELKESGIGLVGCSGFIAEELYLVERTSRRKPQA